MFKPATVPTHRRTVPTLQELVGVSPASVLASMDGAGDDVPNALPSIPVEIAAVGMRRKDVIISLRDPFGSGSEARAVCTIDLAGGVPATRRGLHISRLGDALARSTQRDYADVAECAHELARAVADVQYGRAAVTVWARIAYLEDLTGIHRGSPKQSLEHLRTMARVSVTPTRTTLDVGLRVVHIVACPCVQKTYSHALAAHGARDDAPYQTIRGPLLTHSQRCVTTITVRGIRGEWQVADVLASLDHVLLRTCNTLPRDLELAYVYRAHQQPQFIEDALRSSVAIVSREVSRRAAFDGIAASARSLESIHEFDLSASTFVDAATCAMIVQPEQ